MSHSHSADTLHQPAVHRHPSAQSSVKDAASCSVQARKDRLVVLVVLMDGHIVNVAAGDAADLCESLNERDVSGEHLSTIWPDAGWQAVRDRIRDATRRRLVGTIEIAVGGPAGRRTHELTVLPHGRDRALVVCRDTSRRASFEREVRDLAFRDPVCGLPNRAAFLRHIEDRVNRTRLSGGSLSVLRIGLRGLDAINDTFGRQAGTQLLSALAQRLHDLLDSGSSVAGLSDGASPFVARIDGKELAVVVENSASTDTLNALANALLEALTRPEVAPQGERLNVGARVGIARFPADASTVDTLLANAGVALYDARKHGQTGIRFFSPAPQAKSASSLDMSQELRWALKNDQFHVAYQPWFGIDDGHPHGAEALLRWTHPLRGDVPLAEILPIAQMNDLCDALGDWVLTRAATNIADGRSDERLPIAVNLFARQSFSPHLVERASAILERFGVEPDRIVFEIRANHFLRDMMSAEATARALRDAGFGLTLDHCGFTALSPRSLHRTGITQIKLGRRLIQRLPEQGACDVVAAHLGMAAPLGIDVCATGVEDAEELAALKDIGCHSVQGFLLGRPEPVLPINLAAAALRDP
ncbi:MAG: bifunctional diguanylate cyclase/phosphodiesterase [Pseudomonadota bacterium]